MPLVHSSHALDPLTDESITTVSFTQQKQQEQKQQKGHHPDGSAGPWPWMERLFHVVVHDNRGDDDEPNTGEDWSLRVASLAQTMDASAKGVLHSASSFLGPALIHAATVTAVQQSCGDNHDNHDDDNNSNNNSNSNSNSNHNMAWECDENKARLFGGALRPSSILTISSVVSTILAALCLPVLGGILDRTRHRQTAGAWTAYGLIATNMAQIFLNQDNWMVFALTYTLYDSLNVSHHAIVLAYLQNLTTQVQVLSKYTAQFAMVQFGAMIGYMVIMVLYATSTQANEFHTSSVAHVISGIFGLIVLGYAWKYLFVATPRRHHEEVNLHGPRDHAGLCLLCRLSWMGLWDTIQHIRKEYVSLKWLLFTLLWSPSVGSGSYLSILSTLHKSLVHMTSAEIGVVNLLTMTSAIVGAKLASVIRLNPLQSFQLCLACLAVNNALMALFVKSHDQVRWYMLFQSITGVCFGWLLPTERVLICTLTPALGQESEFMGLTVAVHTAAAWVPPFLFSALNEAGYSLRVALVSQDLLLLLALLSTFLGIGNFEHAVSQARAGGVSPPLPLPTNDVL